jgi:hypothetical protein
MAEKKENQKEFSTCLEDTPFAEMMQKMIGQQRIGSLCAEMMKKIMGNQENGCSFHCTEMMQSMRKKCDIIKEELKKAKEEEGHVRDK